MLVEAHDPPYGFSSLRNGLLLDVHVCLGLDRSALRSLHYLALHTDLTGRILRVGVRDGGDDSHCDGGGGVH